MNTRILYVDDDSNILAACRRSIGRKFDMTFATSGGEGLDILRGQGPFAVVLSDMRMPGMDGVEFICAARKIARDTVYMMLTGNADQETAVSAINKGHIFRFMTKPCPQDVLATTLEAGIAQYRLVTAEAELLRKTLTGSLQALAEVLGLVSPKTFARGSRVKSIANAVVAEMKLEQAWQYEIAAMLSQIGCIVLPSPTVDKVFASQKLSPKEETMYRSHPQHGAKLLRHIPRLEQSAQMIEAQLRRFDQSPGADPGTAEGAVVLGGQILHAAVDFDTHIAAGAARPAAIADMKEQPGEYNPEVLAVLSRVPLRGIDEASTANVRELGVWDLTPGMFAHAEIVTKTGTMLVPKGGEITQAVIQRLRNFAGGVGVKEPIKVLAPQTPASKAA